jgi:hypothetical protein
MSGSGTHWQLVVSRVEGTAYSEEVIVDRHDAESTGRTLDPLLLPDRQAGLSRRTVAALATTASHGETDMAVLNVINDHDMTPRRIARKIR